MATFKFNNAQLRISKAKEGFNPDKMEFFEKNPNWGKRQLLFSAIVGENRHNLDLNVVIAKEEKDRIIKINTKAEYKDGKKISDGESIDVKWSDRNNPEIIAKTATFKKYVFDFEKPSVRKELENIVEDFKDGIPSANLLTKYNIKEKKDAEELLKKSKAKRKEFISKFDFIEYLSKVIKNDRYKDIRYYISGDMTYSYNEKDNKYYLAYEPKFIGRCDDDAETVSTGEIDFIFDKNAVEDADFDETGKATISGWTRQFFSGMEKKYYLVPISLVVDKKYNIEGKKIAEGLLTKIKRGTETDYSYVPLKLDIVNGSQFVELTYDMLTDDQKEDVDFGLTTIEDIQRNLMRNGSEGIKGERLQYIAAIGFARGNRIETTVYTDDDFGVPVKKVKTSNVTVESELDDFLL